MPVNLEVNVHQLLFRHLGSAKHHQELDVRGMKSTQHIARLFLNILQCEREGRIGGMHVLERKVGWGCWVIVKGEREGN